MNYLRLLFCFTLSVYSALGLAGSFEMKVFAEPGAEVRAQEYIDKMKLLGPFRQLLKEGVFQINDEPLVVTSTNCRGGNLGIERLAKCDTAEVEKLCKGADLCPIFTSFPFIGAGGKPFPVSSSSFPWTTMLHEVIHTFGFSDEYSYTQEETGIYCRGEKNSPNERQLSKQKVYDSEKKAIKACIKLISWCKLAVEKGAQVASLNQNGKWIIGSPLPESCPDSTLGVYLGAGCMKKHPQTTYRPYYCPNVMGFPSIGQDNCEVQERHTIIGRMPGLLPEYYQRILFQKILRSTGTKNVTFIKTPEELPSEFSYGIPEVDSLPGGNMSTGKICTK